MNISRGTVRMAALVMGIGALTVAAAQPARRAAPGRVTSEATIAEEDRIRIEQALPATAVVPPAKPRRLSRRPPSIPAPDRPATCLTVPLASQILAPSTGR